MRMRRFHAAGIAVVVAAALSGLTTGLVGLGSPAGADQFRSAAGTYHQFVKTPAYSFADTLTLNTDGTFAITQGSNGGPAGTWSQPKPGTIVLHGTYGGDTWVFRIWKSADGLGSKAQPGPIFDNGRWWASWYAVLVSP